LPLPLSEEASGLWLLELEFSLFSLQMQEQSSGVSGEIEATQSYPTRSQNLPPFSGDRAATLVAGVFRFPPISQVLFSGSSHNPSTPNKISLHPSPCVTGSPVLNLKTIFPALCTSCPLPTPISF
jgi:hypothetical protein